MISFEIDGNIVPEEFCLASGIIQIHLVSVTTIQISQSRAEKIQVFDILVVDLCP